MTNKEPEAISVLPWNDKQGRQQIPFGNDNHEGLRLVWSWCGFWGSHGVADNRAGWLAPGFGQWLPWLASR
jgi:hypothetical protein